MPGQGPGDGDAEGGLPEVWYRVEGELDAMAFGEWAMARPVPRHRRGLAMSPEGASTPRPRESPAAEGTEPPLTLDSIPAVVSARWWREHEDQFEWRKDGTVRLKSDRPGSVRGRARSRG